jgi:hypothetical protein
LENYRVNLRVANIGNKASGFKRLGGETAVPGAVVARKIGNVGYS